MNRRGLGAQELTRLRERCAEQNRRRSARELLLTAVALECGYPASSLRERAYAQPGRRGVLVYTGSPDAQGTLGGLVQAGWEFAKHVGAPSSLRVCVRMTPSAPTTVRPRTTNSRSTVLHAMVAFSSPRPPASKVTCCLIAR